MEAKTIEGGIRDERGGVSNKEVGGAVRDVDSINTTGLNCVVTTVFIVCVGWLGDFNEITPSENFIPVPLLLRAEELVSRVGTILGILHEVEVAADRGVNGGGDMLFNKL